MSCMMSLLLKYLLLEFELCSLFLIVCMGLRGGSSGSKGLNHKAAYEDFN